MLVRATAFGLVVAAMFAVTDSAWAAESPPFFFSDTAAKAAAAAAASASAPKPAPVPTATNAAIDSSGADVPVTDAAAPAVDAGAKPDSETKPAKAATANKAKGPEPIPAKKLFGAVKAPASIKARAIGAYSRGCLAGATALPIDGPAWQAMRLSRNRNWGHPKLIALLEKYASEVKQKDRWPGLLVGDISQPRGGPMLTGHASHQLGLDADIWFTPMPSRRLSNSERENLAATSMLASDNLSVNKKVWGEGQINIVRRVASYPEVERVLVHPAIKKALCEAGGTNRTWLSKVRPYWGHFYHFHVRIGCPSDSPTCTKQAPIPGDDGCGKELDDWFKLLTAPPKPKPKPQVAQPVKPIKPKPPLSLADLPAECSAVLASDGRIETASPPAAAAKPVKATTKPRKPAEHKATADAQ